LRASSSKTICLGTVDPPGVSDAIVRGVPRQAGRIGRLCGLLLNSRLAQFGESINLNRKRRFRNRPHITADFLSGNPAQNGSGP
jgi:hypothetical protein